MLDQNTDRMWFVIGALVIGAGIILLINNTFPALFASTAKTFKGVTDPATDEIEKGLIVNPNLLKNTSPNWKHYTGGFNAKVVSGWVSLEEHNIRPGDQLTFSFDYDFGENYFKPRFMYSNQPMETNDENEINFYGATLLTGSGHYTFTTVVPESSTYVLMLMNNGEFSQKYANATIQLKSLKLEEGDRETRYIQ